MHAFICQCISYRLFLDFVKVRFQIIQDRVRVCFCFPLRQGLVGFFLLTLPFFDDAVAGFSQGLGPCLHGEEAIFSCLAVVDDVFSAVWETVAAAVPVAAVELEHLVCLGFVSINRRSLNPPLSTVAA